MGGGSFDKVADQNFPPYFHWANYTLNKAFSLKGKEPKIEGKT